MTIRLYTFWRSSAAYRVRIALNLKGIAYESVPIHLRRAEHRAAEYLSLNPQGLVPTLEEEGTVLTQSIAIIGYLDQEYPEPRLLPTEPLARARVDAMVGIIACEIHPLNNLRVLNYLRQQLGQDEEAVTGWYRHWVGEAFEPLEKLVADTSPDYCFGASVSLADVCLVPQVYNARRFDCDLSPYPKISRIVASLNASEPFAKAVPENQADAE